MPTNPDQALFEQFQEFIASQGLENGQIIRQQPAAPAPVKIKVGDQELTFNSPEEIERVFNSTLEKTGATIAALEGALKTAQKPVETPSGNDQAAFNVEFYETFQSDPVKAFDMLLNKSVFGGSVQNASQVLRDTAYGAENNRQLLEIARFKDANPGFVPEVHGAALEKIRTALNLPVNAQSLDAAWSAGLKNGIFTAGAPQNDQPSYQPTQAPALPGRFQPQQSMHQQQLPAFDPVTAAKIETMDIGDLETFMRSQNMFG